MLSTSFRRLPRTALLGAGAFVAGLITMPALAHTVWVMPTGDSGFTVHFGGHAGVEEPFVSANFKNVKAVDASGAPLRVTRSKQGTRTHLSINGKPAMLTAHYDNGIHTNRSNGPSVAKPMNQVANAISAVKAVKWHKTITQWSPQVLRPVGQPFEVVPLSAEQPVAGRPMQVKVLINGVAAPNIAIARNEEGRDAVTDARGIASFTPVAGYNKLWSGRRTEVSGNPRYTQESIEYSFGFYAR